MASHSPLLRLPPELRNQIYELCLKQESTSILTPVDLTRTNVIKAQVFDFKIDYLHNLLLALRRLDQKTRALHIELKLTAPGEEDMQQLRRWLGGCRDSISTASDPLQAYKRHYTANIDWTGQDKASVDGVVKALLRLKGGGLKSTDATDIHSTVANAAKRQANLLSGKQLGKPQLGVMGKRSGGGV
ncbi:hypothetical protein LTR36_001598 [Oleoguttula mirabilis]|uniref:Uncharacterized protein n=1 Tax=Oleoguttula mirabilis TaxID=1507867 RepID=A0AAV9JN98_9PEZI|nr:hypothetical protein LTR36_001598 [Oleoguttula mirabilis]